MRGLQHAYAMEQSPVLQFPSSAEPELLVAPAEEIDPVAPGSDPINPKLQYLYDKIMEQESRIFKAVWIELCHAAERHLAMIWQLLKLDLTLGARAPLQPVLITLVLIGYLVVQRYLSEPEVQSMVFL
uniref:Uncharacterized protein n=1 Tax=Romanomermis culicivorax TaxID=13658 RepID=A0A915ISA4_ROMCU